MDAKTRGVCIQQPKWARPLVEEPIRFSSLDSSHKTTLPWTTFFLVILAACGLTASIVDLYKWRFATALVSSIIWVIIILALVVLRPRIFYLTLAIPYVAVEVSQVTRLTQHPDRHGFDIAWSVASLIISTLSIFVVLNMPLRHPMLPRTGISQPFTTPSTELRSPEDNLTMWQWMTVSWMAALIKVGSKRQLNDEDVWSLAYEFQHTPLHEVFRNLTGSIITRLVKATWIDLSILTILALIELAANYSAPLILQQLLLAMQWIDVNKKPAITWAFLTMVVELVAAQSGVFSLWFGRRAYERSRGAMITMLHDKVLHRKVIGGKPDDESEHAANGSVVESVAGNNSQDHVDPESDEQQPLMGGQKTPTRSMLSKVTGYIRKAAFCLPSKRDKDSSSTNKGPASMGKILNVMRNDIYQVAQRLWEFQMLINMPVGLVLSFVLVWRLVGWAAFLGVAVVIVAQIINAVLARMLISWEKVRRVATDHKLQQITQYVEAIRHLRWYGWHTRKLEKVLEARQRELNLNIVRFAFGQTIMFVNALASGILPVATFWAYTALAGNKLSVDIAFPALQLLTLLQQNLRDIPELITILLNAGVSMSRVKDVMNEPDIDAEDTVDYGDEIKLENATFAWPGLKKPVLRNLDVTLPLGLTIVIGPVASGKTAFLQAILGELDLLEGQVIRPDKPIGYCSQTPWLESMTIRDNILFCTAYEPARYKQVLDVCCLLPDLASFKQGDLSPIGENGIGLSGGQKARVALARAMYSGASLLLLDDPLSALDQQTAERIVAKCLSGNLIKDRTVVLVTHRTDLCQDVSQQVIEVSNGRIEVHTDPSSISSGSLRSSRRESIAAEVKRMQESAAVKEKFEDEEHRAHGGVQWNVYWEYIKAGKLKWWFLATISVLFWRLFDYAINWFLKEWSEAYGSIKSHLILVLQSLPVQASESPISRLFDRFPNPADNPNPWLFWLMMIVIIQAFAFVFAQVMMLIVIYTAGKGMFIEIMVKISNATFRFYDVTPIGRLMNRLTGDVGTVDGPISVLFIHCVWEGVSWITSLVIIASVTPLFLVFSIGLAAAFVYIFALFLPSSQSLRRLEMVSLSPLMSNFGALLNGLMTVRAFHAQLNFQNRVIKIVDTFQKMDHFYWSLQSWLQYRFDSLSAVSTFLLTLLAIYSGVSPGLTAFVLIAAQRFVQATHRLCKQYGQLQLDFVSVERVVELLRLEQEEPGHFEPPAYWPSLSSNNPAVEFEDVTLRYAPEMDPALKNISFSIPSGSSTAVIGRTGSGKSTLALAILATLKLDSGRILIDGVDVSQVSKQELRSRVTFLAQEPVLFEGTIRTNLDPMDDYSDEECKSVIDRIHGYERFRWTLETTIEAGGKNLSQGQRQLVGLARAMLRRSSIIIMDEATASVDLETSWEIQRVLKEELAGSTVITVAHRASAVRGCDLVVKLDRGELAAFGPPAEVEFVADGTLVGESHTHGGAE